MAIYLYFRVEKIEASKYNKYVVQCHTPDEWKIWIKWVTKPGKLSRALQLHASYNFLFLPFCEYDQPCGHLSQGNHLINGI